MNTVNFLFLEITSGFLFVLSKAVLPNLFYPVAAKFCENDNIVYTISFDPRSNHKSLNNGTLHSPLLISLMHFAIQ